LAAVVSLGAGAAQLGALRAVQQLPILVFSLFVGVLVDRWRSRTVMVYADLGRALVLAAVPLGWMLGLPFLYVVAFTAGVFTVCFDVAYQAALPRLVERDQLAQGNSMLETTRSAAQICGPALGGVLVSLLTAPIAVLASAVLFAFSSLSIGRIRRLPRMTPEASGGVVRQIRDGLRIVVHDGSLRAIATATCVYQFSFTALTTVYLLFVTRTLDLPVAVVGLVLAAFGPGVLIGSLLSSWLPRWFGYGRVVVFAALISDLVMLCTSALHGSGPAVVAALVTINVLYGVLSQTVDIAVTAIRQAVTPLPVQGRVVATINFLGLGLTPLGALLGGTAAGALGIRTALLAATAGLFLSPLALSLSPLARLGRSLTR
jgi:predicted MFS family arabinose efflux permease